MNAFIAKFAGFAVVALTGALVGTFVPSGAFAQTAWESLLDRLVGRWTMNGAVLGEHVTYSMTGARTLEGRFVELHMKDVHVPPGYEARVLIGCDSTSHRVIAHWMDSFGAAYSVPHGTGFVHGDTLELTFPYAGGPFRDRFTYDRGRDSWQFLLESGDSTGAWSTFASYDVRRAKARR